MYKCLPSVVQSLKTVLKKVIMSHRYKFSHFILLCDINILLSALQKCANLKNSAPQMCLSSISRSLSLHKREPAGEARAALQATLLTKR